MNINIIFNMKMEKGIIFHKNKTMKKNTQKIECLRNMRMEWMEIATIRSFLMTKQIK